MYNCTYPMLENNIWQLSMGKKTNFIFLRINTINNKTTNKYDKNIYNLILGHYISAMEVGLEFYECLNKLNEELPSVTKLIFAFTL